MGVKDEILRHDDFLFLSADPHNWPKSRIRPIWVVGGLSIPRQWSGGLAGQVYSLEGSELVTRGASMSRSASARSPMAMVFSENGTVSASAATISAFVAP